MTVCFHNGNIFYDTLQFQCLLPIVLINKRHVMEESRENPWRKEILYFGTNYPPVKTEKPHKDANSSDI